MLQRRRGGGRGFRRVAVPCAALLCTASLGTLAAADEPDHAWSLVAATPAPASMHPGQKAILTVVARNEGTETWTAEQVRLAPVGPRGRTSPFASEDPTWLWSGGRRVAMTTPVVPPGSVAIFSFTFTAPVLPSYPADLVERFAPIVEPDDYLDEQVVTFTTRVRPAANALPPAPNPPVPNPGPLPEAPCAPADDPQACIEPPGDSYDWSLVAATPAPASMHPGQKTILTVVARNDGSATWRSDATATEPVRLAPVRPRARTSAFASEDPTWLWSGGARIAMATPLVRPGEIGIFSFTFTAPVLASYPQDFTESFAPIAEPDRWMDEQVVTFTTRVRPAAGPVPPLPNPPLPDPRPSETPTPPPPPCDIPEGCAPEPPSQACLPAVEQQPSNVFPPAVAVGYAGFGRPLVGPPLSGPTALAFDPLGKIVIADTRNHRIVRADAAGNVLGIWGTQGSGPGQFESPSGVAVSATGRVYVADTGNDRVQVFSLSGVWLGSFGSSGSAPGSFETPMGLSIVPAGARAGSLVIADAGNDRVQVVTQAGAPLVVLGAGALRAPAAVSAYGADVYVADTGNHRVLRFNPAGAQTGRWGSEGGDRGCMRAPTGIAAGDFGLFVSDTGNTRLQRFSRAGVLLETWGTSGDQPNQFRAPAGLATNGAALWVSEAGGDRVQSFTPQIQAAPPVPCGSDPTLCIP